MEDSSLHTKKGLFQFGEWNATEAEYPSHLGVHELIEMQVRATPHRIAVRFGDRILAYEELNAYAERLAAHLACFGVTPGTLVGISLERSQYLLIGMLGILKCGAAYVPLDPYFPVERLNYMITDAAITILVSESSIADRLQFSHLKTVLLDQDSDAISKNSLNREPVAPFSPGSTAYVIYTSGSTGKPKGVQVPHRAVVNFLWSMKKNPGVTAEDVVLALTTLSFDIAVLELLLPLCVGASCYIMSKGELSDGRALADAIEYSGATVMQATPATWRMLLSSGWTGKQSLTALCGGETFPRDLAVLLHPLVANVWNMYGPTETTVWSTCFRITDPEKPLLIGRPIANTHVYILDSLMQPVPIGEIGELWIGGEGVTKGYLNRPDLTEKCFVDNPFSGSSSKIYKTGDLARYHADGNIQCLGRLDTQVKIRGFRVELEEIEAAIVLHPAIAQCAVTIVEIRPGDVRLVAFIVPVPEENVTGTVVREFLKSKLTAYMIPQHVLTTREIPLTPNGKVDRKKLPALFIPENANCFSSVVTPRNGLQQQLVSIWQEVFGMQEIGITDDFFSLGGHSLLAVQIVAKVAQILNVNILLSTMVTSPTIESLSEVITRIRSDKGTMDTKTFTYIVPLKSSGNRTPFFCVHGIGGNVMNYQSFIPFLDDQQPFYGIQCRGLDGLTRPFHSIGEMASAYVEEIRRVQPEGPYKIGGGSMGGIVAYEMAQLLIRQGTTVELLIMIDSIPHGNDGNSKAYEKGKKSSFFKVQSSRLFNLMLRIKDRMLCHIYYMTGKPVPHELRYWYIEQKNRVIEETYCPPRYNGKVLLFRASFGKSAIDAYNGWRGIADAMTVVNIEAEHNTLIENREMAKRLNDVLLSS